MGHGKRARSVIAGQYTYTTTDGAGVLGGGTYGWKVKEAVGVGEASLSEDVLRWATSRLGLFPAVPVPPLATPDEISRLPRTFRMEVSESGMVNLTHRAPAGKEATGRANSFVHGVLFDRRTPPTLADPTSGGPLKPCDLFGSPHWLEPMGVDQVNAARLSDPPGSSGATPGEDAARWFSTQRAAQAVVLAGFEEAARRNKLLVIIADEPEAGTACLWQIQTFLLAEAAWALPFSTYESLSSGSTPASIVQGIRVVVVASEARAAVAELDAVVLDMTAPRRRENDEWILGDTHIRVGDWSTFIMQVISAGFDDELAETLVDLGSVCGHSADAAPLWGAAAAFLLIPPDQAMDDALVSRAVSLTLSEMPAGLAMPDAVAQQLVSRMTTLSGTSVTAMAEQLQALDRIWAPGTSTAMADVLYGAYLAGLTDLAQGRDEAWMPGRVQLSWEGLSSFLSQSFTKATGMYAEGRPQEAAMLAAWILQVLAHNGIRTAADSRFLDPTLTGVIDLLRDCVVLGLRTPGARFPTLAPLPQFAWDVAFTDYAEQILRQVDIRGGSEGVRGFVEWLSSGATNLAQITTPQGLATLSEADLALASYWYWQWESHPQPPSTMAVMRAAALRWALKTCPADLASMMIAWREVTRSGPGLDEWLVAGLVCELQRGTCGFLMPDMIEQILAQTPLGLPGQILACSVAEMMGGYVGQATAVHAEAWTSVIPFATALDGTWVVDTPTYVALCRGATNPFLGEELKASCLSRMTGLIMLQPSEPLLLDAVSARLTPDTGVPAVPKLAGLTKEQNCSALWMGALALFPMYPEASSVTPADLAGMVASRWALAPIISPVDPFASWLGAGEHARRVMTRIAMSVNRRDLERKLDEATTATARMVAGIAKEQGLGRGDGVDEVRSRLGTAKKTLLPKDGQSLFTR